MSAQKETDAKSTWGFDLVAGLTVAAVVLPKALAFATVAGLPVSVGLYTVFLPMLIYAVLGSSKVLSVSTSSTIGILTGVQLLLVVPDGDPQALLTASVTLTALVGLILILASVLRLGFVANFISTPVLTGFKAGVGIVIVLDQLPKLLGFHVESEGFFHTVFNIVTQLPQTSFTTLAVALVTLALLFGFERFFPRIPAPLVAVAACIAAVWYFNLGEQGVAIVGEIPQGFPSLVMPELALVRDLLPGAIGIALMSFTESTAAARAFLGPNDPPLNANRELLATGAANLGSAFIGAMPGGGGTTQTAVMRASGARSQVASVMCALVALATMMFLAPVLAMLPYATLGAVVIAYSVGLIKPSEFLAIRSVRKMEFYWAVVACLGVLFFGTLEGIVAAIAVSMLGLAAQTAKPKVSVIVRKLGEDVLRPLDTKHNDNEDIPGLLIVRPEGRIYFVNVQYVADEISRLVKLHQPKVVVLDMSRVSDIEYSALQILVEGESKVSEPGAELWVADLNPEVLEVVRRVGLAERLGPRLLYNARSAIARYKEQH
ncbi:SulP family inorganic anion transporter [Motilimonas sp. KMU-193]|uniref:SulP family inorganic anion transporter n=1 Tax=Motilimonas sp. KMU-193 TaxID=3388668 RepID=UPI00396B445F